MASDRRVSELDPSIRPLARHELARVIDHTLRRADATAGDVEAFCSEAREFSFFSVCVNGSRIALAAERLQDSPVKVTCAIDFPLGAADADVKRFEVETALDQGAHIFEVAANIGHFKDGNVAALLREMRDVVEAADERPVSIGLDTRFLEGDELERFCRHIVEAGVKGVTLPIPAEIAAATEVTRRVAAVTGENFGIKIDCQALARVDVVTLLEAGATRFGMTGGIELLRSL